MDTGRNAMPTSCSITAAANCAGTMGFPAWRFVHWSVRALRTDVDWADVGAALANSLWWSLLAAVATTLLAVPVGGDPSTLRDQADALRDRLGSGVVVLGHAAEGKVTLLAAVTKDLAARAHVHAPADADCHCHGNAAPHADAPADARARQIQTQRAD